MRKLFLSVSFLWMVGLFACTTPEKVSSVPPLATDLSPTLTPSAVVQTTPFVPTQEPTIQPQEIPVVLSIQQIDSDHRFYDLQWSQDSKFLYSGPLVYNVEHEFAKEFRTLEDPSIPTAQPDILLNLPSGATEPFVSPDGSQVLYFILTTPTPTPIPDEDGKTGYSDYKIEAELWLYKQNGEVQRLGAVEFCIYDEPIWIDGQKVILSNWEIFSNCGDTQAWLVDLQNNDLSPLFPREIYQTPVRLYELSPDGKNLLFSTIKDYSNPYSSLFALDMVSREATELNFPNTSHGEQWLTNEKFLVSYLKSADAPHLTLGIYDLNKAEVVELTPKFKGSCIRLPTVSPDLKWLVFATGEGIDACNILTEVWLMELNLNP